MPTDPVCGMPVEEGGPGAERGGERYFFCSDECRKEFSADPDRYLSETPIVEVSRVSKTYVLGKVPVKALDDVSLRIFRGDFAAIIGKSGSGKSTLMHLIGLLDRPTKGSVRVAGTDTSRLSDEEAARHRGERIGFVFQKFHLIASLTALQNVLLPAVFRGVRPPLDAARRILDEVGLSGRINHRPAELSGGEQQRLAVARALINDPEIILADEPTGNLDSKTGREVLALLERLRSKGKTLVVVTHDPFIAERAERIFNLSDGRIFRGHAAAHPYIGMNSAGKPGHAVEADRHHQ